ncbi:hypothetical protein ACZ11_10760 [Lysinibacillus xylanilyticus]|uniref:Uncharacterized protein n=1 Tax=Lysinibacillus xylanilyticus TaxID=582475 RepID=A0A0K9FDN4_9BACI|nr:hypothetical protein [Lysinibacillus xylanilyticus]KMY32585.1 hypothetical protein ACZ11_10760 [Lysinibacillus xylanilyticus]
MNLEIGYLPKKYFNRLPSDGGYPFYVSKNVKYALNIGPMYYPDIPDEQLVLFKESLSSYPFYYFFELGHEDEIYPEIHQNLIATEIVLEKVRQCPTNDFFLVTINNREQLLQFLPCMFWQHNFNMSTLWSNNKHAFIFEEKTWEYNEIRDTVCLKFDQPTSIFWLGHDFMGTDIFSNEEKFSSIEQTIHLFPDFITIEIVEFE